MILIVVTFTEKFAWEGRVDAHQNMTENFGKFTSLNKFTS